MGTSADIWVWKPTYLDIWDVFLHLSIYAHLFMTYIYSYHMLPHCQFSVSDYKSYFQLFTIHRIQKILMYFTGILCLVLLKPFFKIDLCNLLLWRSTHKCNWGKGEKITYLVYFNSLGENNSNNSPPAKILLQNVDLNCSSEKKKKSHSSVKNEVT